MVNGFITVVLLLGLSASAVHANNSYFLPGDAFFFSRLSAKDLARMEKKPSPVIDYGQHWDGGFGCGSAGYTQLRLTKMSKFMKQELPRLITQFDKQLEWSWKVKEGSNDIVKDQKVICVFVYNADYDWKKHGIALQYNENWKAETRPFGYQKAKAIRIERFVSQPSQYESHKNSKSVPALKTKIPKFKKNGEPDREGVVQLNGDYKFVVIPRRNFEDYRKRKDRLPLVVLTKTSRQEYVTKNGKWIKVKTDK